jgi:MFS family permease
MSEELGWDTVEQGHVKAAFASGYLWLQIAGGVAGDRFGNKAFQVFSMLACGVGMWAVPYLIGGGGAPEDLQGTDTRGDSFAVARVVYFLMGLSCGPQHPTGTAMLSKWCLPAEKAWVSSMDALSSIVGSLLSTLVIGVVIELLGWRATMRAMALATGGCLTLFALLASDSPARAMERGRVAGGCCAGRGFLRMSEDEARLFEDVGMLRPVLRHAPTPVKSAAAQEPPRQAGSASGGAPARRGRASAGGAVRELFTSSATWGCYLAHATYNFVRYTIEQEMPKFFSDQLGSGHAKTGLALATLHVSAFCISMLLKDRVGDAINGGRVSLLGVRKRAAGYGYGLVAVGVGLMSVAAWTVPLPPWWIFICCIHVRPPFFRNVRQCTRR